MSDVIAGWEFADRKGRKPTPVNDGNYFVNNGNYFVSQRHHSIRKRQTVSYASGEEDIAYINDILRSISLLEAKWEQQEFRRSESGENLQKLSAQRIERSGWLIKIFAIGLFTVTIGIFLVISSYLFDLFAARVIGSIMVAIGACAVSTALMRGQQSLEE